MKRLVLILLALALAAAVFVIRHSALRQSQSERQNLEAQVRQLSETRASTNDAGDANTRGQTNGLSPEERSELLKLRGEVSVLLSEIAEESNRLATLSKAQTNKPSGHRD